MGVIPINGRVAARAAKRVSLMRNMSETEREACLAKLAECTYENTLAAVAAAMADDGDEKFDRTEQRRY